MRITALRRAEMDVLRAVADAGAITTRRITEQVAIRPNWYRLLEFQLLTELHTLYGAVLIIAVNRREQVQDLLGLTDMPYVAGPAVAADRAYQNDALQLLETEGYELDHCDYKRTALNGIVKPTSIVTRAVLRIPRSLEQLMKYDYPGQRVAPPQFDYLSGMPEVYGYPSLYATVANGGVSLARLKRLYRSHEHDIHIWRHPLIVAVPDDRPYRAYLRKLDVERSIAEEGAGLYPLHYRYGLIRLLVLPIPG